MTTRKVFHDSVIELPAQLGVTPSGLNVSAAREDHQTETMEVSFS
jgi:kumamolisin